MGFLKNGESELKHLPQFYYFYLNNGFGNIYNV